MSEKLTDADEQLAELFFQCARYERPSTDWKEALLAYKRSLAPVQEGKESIADLIPQWYEGVTHEQMLDEAFAQIRLLEAAVPASPGWVACSERLPEKDGRLWAILVDETIGGHGALTPLYEFYHFDNGWATDDKVTHWLDYELPSLPATPHKEGS